MSSDEPKILDQMLAHAPPQDGYSATMLALEAYDETYGIYDYSVDDPTMPLALVAMHPKEDCVSNGRLEKTIKAFRRSRVYKHYGLSLNEFLQLPRHIGQFILNDCYDTEREEGKRAGELLEGLEGK